jgi:DNA-binding SARP family transcriptional activator
MQAEGRRREIAAEFSATPLAARRECTTVLEALAGTDSRVEGEASIVRSTPQALESLISPAEIGLPSDRLRITTFGRLAVMRAGESEPVSRSTWGSRKARLLLAYFLAADPESRGVTREALCEAVWPESDSLHLERTFRVTMTFLRRAVEAGGDSASATPPGASGARLLAFRDGRYRLACDGFWCDAREFDRLTAGAAASERGGDPVAALQKRGAAFELYQGEFLADFDEPWIEPRRERYRRQFVQIGTALFDAALAGGRREEAEEVAERIVACDPLAEEGHQLLIRAYLAAGRRDAAVRQLERCRILLRTELGIEVSPRTAGLLGRDGSGR